MDRVTDAIALTSERIRHYLPVVLITAGSLALIGCGESESDPPSFDLNQTTTTTSSVSDNEPCPYPGREGYYENDQWCYPGPE